MLSRADIENAVRLDRATRLQSAASGLRSPDFFTGDLMADATFDMPPPSAGFDARGGWLVNRLMADLALTPEQAAGIVGGLGGESGLLAIQEKHPISGAGGFGWEQATGPRRADLEKYAADHGLKDTDDAANYGFLIQELQGSQAHALEQVKKTTTVDAAVYTFDAYFERPADLQADATRGIGYGYRALAAAATAPIEQSALPRTAPQPAQSRPTAPVVPTPAPAPVQPAPVAPPPKLSGAQGTALGGGLTASLAGVLIWATTWPLHPLDGQTAMSLAGALISGAGLLAHLSIKVSTGASNA